MRPKHWGLPHWPTPNFTTGDVVTFKWGNSDLEGMVIEDRGAYGKPPHHIYTVEADFDAWNREKIELPEEELTLKHRGKIRV